MNINCPYLEMQCENLVCDCPKYKAYLDAKKPEIVERVLLDNHFDTSLPTWNLLMQMQTSFAGRIRKIDNLTKEEIDKWVDKYLICIEDEVREVREHLILYKKQDNKIVVNVDDHSNIDMELKKEVIDILHFIMDLFIVGNADDKIIEEYYRKQYSLTKSFNDLIADAYLTQRNYINDYLYTDEDINYDITTLKASCKLLDACALVRQHISWKHWKKPNNFIDMPKLYNAFAIVLHEFINLCILTMDLYEIRTIYINKNIENILRQEYGY